MSCKYVYIMHQTIIHRRKHIYILNNFVCNNSCLELLFSINKQIIRNVVQMLQRLYFRLLMKIYIVFVIISSHSLILFRIK